jgi:LmbE family N-acetylglucosaminyl deacetylase
MKTDTQLISALPPEGRRGLRLPFFLVRNWLFLMPLLMLFFSERLYPRPPAAPSLRLEDMPHLPLKQVKRLLVIAPHPDDETLGTGGAIQAALAQGSQVKIIIVTNGDGQAVAPLLLRREIRPRPGNYIATGQQRQAEALAALKILGVPQDSVFFLGYPDRGLIRLWENHWNREQPLHAAYTWATRSPYPLTFNPQSAYCGYDLLADLWAIIDDYRPDLLLSPHPNDKHADHQATAHFTRLALALKRVAEPAYQPATLSYLIHYGHYPQPRGLHPTQTLLPPTPLAGAGKGWTRLDLAPDQVQVKARAIQDFPSQQLLLGSFLTSFVRRDEIFANLPLPDISPVKADKLAPFETEQLLQPLPEAVGVV